MNAPEHDTPWIEANQQALNGELAWLRQRLEQAGNDSANGIEAPRDTAYTLDFLGEQFRLSPFERSILLLCAGMELHSEIAPLCGKAQGDARHAHPSFALALSLLPEAHWSALSPSAPLRYWQLIHVDDPSRITSTRLSLDEGILHFLLGDGHLDQRVASLARPLTSDDRVPPPQQGQLTRLINLWSQVEELPVIVLRGNDPLAARALATEACRRLQLQPLLLRANDIPVAAEERSLLARLLSREFLLSRSAVLIDAGDDPPPQLAAFMEQLTCPMMLLGTCPAGLQLATASIEIHRPSSEEQRELWRTALAGLEAFDEAELSPLVAQFSFSSTDIATVAKAVRSELQAGTPLEQTLWQNCRRHGRGNLEHLAQRIVPRADWDDLVLPRGQKAILHDISRQVRHRTTVYQTWGFAGKSERGLGISALFTGESGTGKTLAAEVLAGDLQLDLYRIDLSAVVSKYIGETEKNLERLFSAAESSGAILLFDEADALFGKRSEVKDSHDRYANIELAYLLQRMEAYRGLSILTSNLRSALDRAFLRRIRFVVQFPYPDVAQRNEIWQRIFPNELPREELDTERLARLHVAGGNIRNIAMNAAFLAAEKGGPLGMADLAQAARMEYAKLEKPLNESELRQWT